MKLQFLRGVASLNDAYTGAEGELTVDLEAGRVRLHDGITQGGREIFPPDWWVGSKYGCQGRQGAPGGSYDFAYPNPGGFFRIGGGPSNGADVDGLLKHPSGSVSWELTEGNNGHIFLLFADRANRPPSIYQKGYSSNGDTRWTFNYNTENSFDFGIGETGGRPTRGILQTHENGNGLYERFADGLKKDTIVKTVTLTNDAVVDYGSGRFLIKFNVLFPTNIPYPSTFIDSNVSVYCNLEFTDTDHQLSGYRVVGTNAAASGLNALVVGNDVLVGAAVTLTLEAYGRWY